MAEAIRITHLTKSFQEKDEKEFAAIKSIDLVIAAGEFFVLVGPSGSGKSTFLRILSGLEHQFEGTVSFGEGYGLEDIAFVFQQFALLPWLTVFQNVEFGLLNRIVSEKERAHIVTRELKQFGLEKFSRSYPKELSGGMQQRVGLARALAIDPKIIFLDEPFSELDSFTAEELRNELLRIWEERKMTVVMVTHIVEEAVLLGDRVAVFTPHPGRLERVVDVSLSRSRDKRSEEFYKISDLLYKIIKP